MPTWIITIAEIGAYKQVEARNAKAAQVIAHRFAVEEAECIFATLESAGKWDGAERTDWLPSDPYAYKLQVMLLPKDLPSLPHLHFLSHLWTKLRGRLCSICDDHSDYVRVTDDEGTEAVSVFTVPGRNTLKQRQREGEYGTLRVALYWDEMAGIAPDIQSVLEWEIARKAISETEAKS